MKKQPKLIWQAIIFFIMLLFAMCGESLFEIIFKLFTK